jgi:hypothetical protein
MNLVAFAAASAMQLVVYAATSTRRRITQYRVARGRA